MRKLDIGPGGEGIQLKGGITNDEGHLLSKLAAFATHSIVEIGSYYGKSTCYIASGAPDGVKVYAIDLWNLREVTSNMIVERKSEENKSVYDESVLVEFKFQNDGSGNITQRILPDTWNTFQQQIRLTNNEHKIIPIKANSNEVAKLWNKNISLLFIDGDHTYEQCLADYTNFAPFIVQGGYIAFHDYSSSDEHNYGVKAMVDTIVKVNPAWGDWQIIDSLIVAKLNKKG